MNTVEILKSARELIEDEKKWTQGGYCRVSGEIAGYAAGEPLPQGADCFCAIGSLAWVGNMTICEAEASEAFKLLTALTDEDGCEVHEFNDLYSHSTVLRLFDRAIKHAERAAA